MVSVKWLAVAALILSALMARVHAAQIDYTISSLGGTSWRYDYVVTNDSVGPLEEFTIWFDRTLYGSLAVASADPSWDALAAQPDYGLPSDGFFDALALTGDITRGSPVAGLRCFVQLLGCRNG